MGLQLWIVALLLALSLAEARVDLGRSCISFDSCDMCLSVGFCVWCPVSGACIDAKSNARNQWCAAPATTCPRFVVPGMENATTEMMSPPTVPAPMMMMPEAAPLPIVPASPPKAVARKAKPVPPRHKRVKSRRLIRAAFHAARTVLKSDLSMRQKEQLGTMVVVQLKRGRKPKAILRMAAKFAQKEAVKMKLAMAAQKALALLKKAGVKGVKPSRVIAQVLRAVDAGASIPSAADQAAAFFISKKAKVASPAAAAAASAGASEIAASMAGTKATPMVDAATGAVVPTITADGSIPPLPPAFPLSAPPPPPPPSPAAPATQSVVLKQMVIPTPGGSTLKVSDVVTRRVSTASEETRTRSIEAGKDYKGPLPTQLLGDHGFTERDVAVLKAPKKVADEMALRVIRRMRRKGLWTLSSAADEERVVMATERAVNRTQSRGMVPTPREVRKMARIIAAVVVKAAAKGGARSIELALPRAIKKAVRFARRAQEGKAEVASVTQFDTAEFQRTVAESFASAEKTIMKKLDRMLVVRRRKLGRNLARVDQSRKDLKVIVKQACKAAFKLAKTKGLRMTRRNKRNVRKAVRKFVVRTLSRGGALKDLKRMAGPVAQQAMLAELNLAHAMKRATSRLRLRQRLRRAIKSALVAQRKAGKDLSVFEVRKIRHTVRKAITILFGKQPLTTVAQWASLEACIDVLALRVTHAVLGDPAMFDKEMKATIADIVAEDKIRKLKGRLTRVENMLVARRAAKLGKKVEELQAIKTRADKLIGDVPTPAAADASKKKDKKPKKEIDVKVADATKLVAHAADLDKAAQRKLRKLLKRAVKLREDKGVSVSAVNVVKAAEKLVKFQAEKGYSANTSMSAAKEIVKELAPKDKDEAEVDAALVAVFASKPFSRSNKLPSHKLLIGEALRHFAKGKGLSMAKEVLKKKNPALDRKAMLDLLAQVAAKVKLSPADKRVDELSTSPSKPKKEAGEKKGKKGKDSSKPKKETKQKEEKKDKKEKKSKKPKPAEPATAPTAPAPAVPIPAASPAPAAPSPA